MNCADLNCCSNSGCYETHKKEFPNHSFILIDEPLPFTSENLVKVRKPTPLAEPFEFVQPLNSNHYIDC